MDAETQAHIFEPFFTTKEQGKGNWFGSGHCLWRSEAERRFSSGFTANWAEALLSKSICPEWMSLRLPSQWCTFPVALARGTETVLLAEDEQDVREVARANFWSPPATSFWKPRTAAPLWKFPQYNSGAIDLLITDMVHLPGMSGQELRCRKMRGLRDGIRVIYIVRL